MTSPVPTIQPKLNNLDYAGQYDLREMSLILSGNAQAFDIRYLMVEFNVYEDMLGGCISGNITISDSSNMLSRFGFSGNERLKLSVDTPTRGTPLEGEFIVYSMSPVYTNPSQSSKRQQLYVLNFCSPEKLKDLQLVVTKSYKSTPISKIVADIIGANYINTKKNVQIEETSGPQDLIVPGFHPMKAINWLATRAVSSNKNPDFVFFESRLGYHFMSLETLFTNTPSRVQKFIMDPNMIGNPNTGMVDIHRRMNTIKDFAVMGSPDMLHQTQQGTFASSLSTYDPVRMIFTEIPYSIVNGFGGMKGPGGTIGTPPYLPNYDGANRSNARRYFYPTNYNQSQTQYGQINAPNTNNTLVENFVGKRQSLLSGMQTFKVRVALNGNLGLTVGAIVDLAIPNFDRKAGDEVNSMSDVYSGRYLTTAIRHQFGLREHTTFIEAVKGSPTKGLVRI